MRHEQEVKEVGKNFETKNVAKMSESTEWSSNHHEEDLLGQKGNKRNLATANRSCVSCAHNSNNSKVTQGHSRSSEASRFDTAHMISYYRSIVNVTLSCIVSHIIARHWLKIAKFIYNFMSSKYGSIYTYPTCIKRRVGGDSVGIWRRCLVLGKLY